MYAARATPYEDATLWAQHPVSPLPMPTSGTSAIGAYQESKGNQNQTHNQIQLLQADGAGSPKQPVLMLIAACAVLVNVTMLVACLCVVCAMSHRTVRMANQVHAIARYARHAATMRLR